jgi:hypothetical protein
MSSKYQKSVKNYCYKANFSKKPKVVIKSTMTSFTLNYIFMGTEMVEYIPFK